jgi:hypothetical protein
MLDAMDSLHPMTYAKLFKGDMPCFIETPVDLCVCISGEIWNKSLIYLTSTAEIMTAFTIAYHLLPTTQCLVQVKQPAEVQQQP